MEFSVPKGPKIYTTNLINFLGVDFTSIIPDAYHGSNIKNVINTNGKIETRPGYAQIGNTFSGKINGVWNIDASSNIFIIHVGTKLYESNDTFTETVELFTGMSDTISQGAYINNKLVIFDGNRAIIYGKFGESWSAGYLDTKGYIPTTIISRNPDGTNGTVYEDINLIQSYRINSFLSDGTSTVYKLESAYDNEIPTVTKLTSEGTIVELTVQSFDNSVGTVTFASAPEVSPVSGRDNIFIKFKVTNTELVNYINKCTILTTYGYDGNNNRLFITGNPTYPNIDWFSQLDDVTYFPSGNYTKVGFEPIINYLRLNDGTLAIQKKVSDTDATVYYRTSAILNDKEVFPIDDGVKTIGCIGKYANANLLNDPLTLTSEGVYGIIGSNYDENFAMERSYYVNKKLLAETNLENAIGIVYKNKYYLGINNHVYIADSRFRTKVQQNANSDYEYEWFYWDNVPVRIWFIYNNELYFGTSTGKIYKFNDTCLDITTPIDCYYETGFLDLGSIIETKTIKEITLITKPDDGLTIELGYIIDDETGVIINKTFEASTFPGIIQEKNQIKRTMYIKFYMKNNTDKKMNFCQLGLKYIFAGRYKGD